ncbi:hypothetical protein MTsPCn9_31830 [Croceitalea sp. MTPC9]|nr:hypothetical protein MTsPCn6_16790 [Croceitalea sp. MTPC6]GMN18243.1 hypothetical protein MTsPCn9_31830 [Croceitalea sp. MTPC9]
MKVENENKKEYLEKAIVFHLILLIGVVYLLIKLGVKIFENM